MQSKPFSQMRRRLLAAAGLSSGCLLPGCASPFHWGGTFIQPWPEHAQLTQQQWNDRFNATKELGFDHVILQWCGRHGVDADWQFPDSAMINMFDAAQAATISVTTGFRHDDRWQQILKSDSLSQLSSFFDSTVADCVQYAQSAPWRTHKAFKGWYIPYEIEQYSWPTAERATLLASWIARLTAGIREQTEVIPSISTYVSVLKTTQTLEAVWETILGAEATIRPMLQDGAGVAGLDHARRLEPLESLLRSANIDFDLILELFTEEQNAGAADNHFEATSADYDRIKSQLRHFHSSGAKQAIAFAIDPWVIGPTPEAKALHKRWKEHAP